MPKNSFATAVYYTLVLTVGVFLIMATKQVAFINQGDFARSVGFMLDAPIDPLPGSNLALFGFVWRYQEGSWLSVHAMNSSSAIFLVAGLVQKIYSNYFNVFAVSLGAKVALLWLGHLLAQRAGEHLALGWAGRTLAFVLLAVSLFYAHNIALLNSFYQEYAYFLFLPVVLLGCMSPRGRRRSAYLLIGALMCGAAKTQFVYIPLLLLTVIAASDFLSRQRLDLGLMIGLLLVQAACVALASSYQSSSLNFYHSTYTGSYVVLSDDELRALGLDEREVACVGVDAWGNRLDGPGGTQVSPGHRSCVGMREISVRDILAPYLKYPDVALRIWRRAMPSHFTVDYFHVYRELRYALALEADALGRFPRQASSLRESYVTPLLIPLVALGLALPVVIWLLGLPCRLCAPSLFLSLMIVSQIGISILGEGLRDLSRHMSAAQLGLDLLVLLCLAQVYGLGRGLLARRRDRSQWAARAG